MTLILAAARGLQNDVEFSLLFRRSRRFAAGCRRRRCRHCRCCRDAEGFFNQLHQLGSFQQTSFPLADRQLLEYQP